MKSLLKNRTANQFIEGLVLLCLAIISFPAYAIPKKPVPPRLVNDYAGILTPAQENSLEKVLVAFDDSTSNQIAVVTTNDLEGLTSAEYGTEIGLEWEIGSAEFDNGIVIVVKPRYGNSRGEVNISIGYGLEGPIPDSYAKRIIETEMIPRFRNDDYFGGIANACAVLMKLASGEISEPRETEEGDEGISWAAILIFLFLAILFMISFNGRNGGGKGGPRYEDRVDDITKAIIIGSLLNSGGHSRGPFGGGFSRGSFGGGGFGGFGGGSFGGGGASGSW